MRQYIGVAGPRLRGVVVVTSEEHFGTITLDIYWYLPFSHKIENRLAGAVGRLGDHLVVESLALVPGETASEFAGYEVRRDLPRTPELRSGSWRWGRSRTAVYMERSRRRRVLVRSQRFDVAHIHLLNYFTDWRALRRLGREAPLISNVHDVVPHQARLPRRVERRLLRGVYANCGLILVAHRVLAEKLEDEFAIAPERIRIVPLPVHSVDPPPRYVVSPTEINVLFFGTFRPNKGIPVLLEAIRMLGDVTDVRFHLAGTGDPHVEQQVRQAAAQDTRITAEIGFVRRARLDSLYRSASLVVLPYTSFASQSGVLRDAYGYGAPVIVSDVGALGEAVREDGTGWVVPPGDAEALAAALRTAGSDPAARAEYAVAVSRVAAGRTFALVGAAIRDIYEEVAR